jgi:8-oxo-dGTP pyrophosphatase MutT (NUDIX family)
MNIPAFCHQCGTKYHNNEWPRECQNCGHQVWKNPIPVACILQPMTDGDRVGLLILKRAIEPHLGGWSLPGGFMDDIGENAEQGAMRELYEETGIKLEVEPSIINSVATGRGQVLFMCESKQTLTYDPNVIKLCTENSDFRVAWEPEDLAFPIHREAMKQWFYRKERAERFITSSAAGITITGSGSGPNLLEGWSRK